MALAMAAVSETVTAVFGLVLRGLMIPAQLSVVPLFLELRALVRQKHLVQGVTAGALKG